MLLIPRGVEVVRAQRRSNDNIHKFHQAACLRRRARPGPSPWEAEAPKLNNSNLDYKAVPGVAQLQQHPGSSNHQEHHHHQKSISCLTHVIFQKSAALRRSISNHTTAGPVVQFLSGMLLVRHLGTGWS
ncbi:unnamed protein product [Polarella glacialis]|uniref:Uncharacterized protein n=1 Tax=Polarella glacialis TaxID=89957 RepID=A0A813EBX5_POLGL|nr:unnamed protein product [Polarella glacialis]